jgi:Ca2+-binding RTX toxin-like protein
VPSPGRSDAFAGSPGNSSISTFDGDDRVEEIWGGDDLILLGRGWDLAFGGPGADWMEGGTEPDLIAGGRGNDVLYTEGPGDALMVAAPEYAGNRDRASGGDGDDILIGSGRIELLEGGAGADLLFGGAGNDFLYGDGAFLNARLNEVHDEMITSGPNAGLLVDVVRPLVELAGDSFPSLSSTVLRDVPGAGDDEIMAGPGNDIAHGGSGSDTIDGDAGADQLFGGPGDDTVRGGDDADVLHGEVGADLLDGGRGPDTIHANAGDIVLLRPGDGLDSVVFQAAADTVTIRVEAEDVVVSGNSVLLPSDHAEGMLFSAPGAALAGLRFEFADGRRTTFGELAARTTIPENRVATLPPAAGPGSDSLSGSTPVSYLAGGAGDDTYAFKAGDGRDTIFDEAGSDTVDMQDVAAEDASVFSSGNDLLLRYPGGEVRLVGQASDGFGVETVRFADATWDRAALAAGAQALAPTAPLGIAAAAAGEPFAYAIAEDAFGEPYLLGTPQLEVAAMGGAPLPAWLAFDAQARTLSGTPAASDAPVVPLLVGLRDGADLIAAAPLVIAVEGTTQVVEPPIEPGPLEVQTAPVEVPATTAEAPLTSVLPISSDNAVVEIPVPLALPLTAAEASSESAFPEAPAPLADTPAFAARESVGEIADPVYERVEALLSAPATTHAAGFVQRYADAIREFNERSREANPPQGEEPPPSDEEIAAYNAALHAWLDDDHRRVAGAGTEDAWDYGGWADMSVALGKDFSGNSFLPDQALARPGLALRAIHAQPGLSEGSPTGLGA